MDIELKNNNENVNLNIMTVHYIYKITLLKGSLEGHYYLGKRTKHLPKYLQKKNDIYTYMKENPDCDSYCGSGKIITDYFKKYGKEYKITYNKEIIDFSDSFEENKNKEEYIVGDLYKSDKCCLNLIKGGTINPVLKGENNPSYKKEVSEETKRKISESLKKYYETHSQKWAGKIKRTDEQKKQISDSLKEYYKIHENPNLGKQHSEKTKQILSQKQKENWENEEYRNKQKETRKKHLEENPGYYAHLSRKVSNEEKKLMSERIKGTHNIKNQGNNNGMYGKIPANARSVLQYDKEGNFIKEWPSVAAAKRELGIDNISTVCNGKRHYAGGFVWKYGENNYSSKPKAVLQYSLEGELIAEFSSSWEAAKQLGFQSSSIHSVCSGKTHTHKGYIWKFKE